MTPRRLGFAGTNNDRGVTLVELVMFIAIAGFVALAMFQAFSGTMRGSHYGKQLTHATQLAQQRMEVILGQRKSLGYSSFTAANYDPCGLGLWGAVEACAASAYAAGSFTVSSSASSFATDACGAGTGNDCRLIDVVVQGPYGDTLARLTAQVWNY